MTSKAPALSEKEQKILDCALKLLRETGDAGLTMRRIADCADIRLSNVQYYFRSRDDVLRVMVTRYIATCTQTLIAALAETSGQTTRVRAQTLIRTGLRHGEDLTEMCRIFRELWALSSRNQAVQDEMTQYYRSVSDQIADFILGETSDSVARDKLRCLLLPYFEGYSIVAPSLPMRGEEVVSLLTDMVMTIVEQSAASPIAE